MAISVRSDTPLAGATLHAGDRDVPLERSSDGQTFRGLLGIDLESAPGPRALSVEAEDPCGGRHAARFGLRVVSGRFRIERLTVPQAYVEPPESERERIRAESERVARVWESGDPERRWVGPFPLPVAGEVRDTFGSRRILNREPRSPHGGVDIAARAGTPVAAPAAARVALAEDLYFSGGSVILDHGGGLFTSYFHLSRIDVNAGDSVSAGQTIGAVGATGRVTGPHLHWGARLHAARINPLALRQLPRWSPISKSVD